MQIDSYAPCPCGSGKKIKFCCSKDILHDLDKVFRALDGEQYVSALDQVVKLIEAKGPKPALLAIQAETYLALQQLPEAEKAAAKLLEVMPHSTVGLAFQAIADVVSGKADDAVKHLQQSIENVDQIMLGPTTTAMSVVAQALMTQGKVLAARGHLLMRAGLSGGKDEESVRAITELNQIERLPTLFKQDFQYATCPPGVPWSGEFEAAMRSARRGAWLAACESLESLAQKVPNQPAVLRNIAILRGWLGQNEEAIEAWRKYIALPDVPSDEAIESEALCQLLSRGDGQDVMDVLQITYTVRDVERLMEKLLSDKRVEAVPFDPQEVTEEGQPPPKGVFKLLDRAPVEYRDGLTLKDLPLIVGDLFVHGKQTDREARLVLDVERSERLNEVKAALLEIAGDCIDPQSKEEVQGQISTLQFYLNPQPRLPHDIPRDRALELLGAQRDEIYSVVWPNLRRSVFQDKSAREAVQDPALRIRVSAAILNLELATDEQFGNEVFDFNQLRRDLGLPERGDVEIGDQDIIEIPGSRLGRLKFDQLSDEQLVGAFRLATLKNMRLAMRRSAQELVSRPSIAEKVDLAEVYRLLVGVSTDTDEALQHIDQGRKLSVTKGRSPAPWYLMELQIRLSRYEAEECNRLTRLLATRHSKEPGISEGLYEILVRYGVISPDGQVAGQPPAAAAGAGEPVAAAPQAAPGLWTPDSAAPKQESKLWLPGMQ
jgi:tetratricopeptide (TPR) repeat protein